MIKMFTQWRIDKLKIKIAGLNREMEVLDIANKSVSHCGFYSEIFTASKNLAEAKESLRILESRMGD